MIIFINVVKLDLEGNWSSWEIWISHKRLSVLRVIIFKVCMVHRLITIDIEHPILLKSRMMNALRYVVPIPNPIKVNIRIFMTATVDNNTEQNICDVPNKTDSPNHC